MQLVAHQNALYCLHLNWSDEIETVKRWRVAAIVICLSAALWLKGDLIPLPRLPSTVAASPPVILWAWEEPEDLRSVDVRQLGVALLAERLFLGSDVRVLRRRQRILVPNRGVWAEAVVRIESVHGYVDTEILRAARVQEPLRAAALPNVRSLQVDFDATERQRLFYADWVKAHPTDPRDAELLGFAFRAMRNGCNLENSTGLRRQVFETLHTRYPPIGLGQTLSDI